MASSRAVRPQGPNVWPAARMVPNQSVSHRSSEVHRVPLGRLEHALPEVDTPASSITLSAITRLCPRRRRPAWNPFATPRREKNAGGL
jgi:hypothetical protein